MCGDKSHELDFHRFLQSNGALTSKKKQKFQTRYNACKFEEISDKEDEKEGNEDEAG